MRQKVVSETINLSELPAHRALAVRITAAGIRQNRIAARLGFSPGHLSHVLAGRKPLSPELVARIGEAIAAEEAAA